MAYRLGVHGPLSDVDILCIGPKHITRNNHFFGKEKFCLEFILAQISEITEIIAIPRAQVPILKFKILGIPIDLLYACLTLKNIDQDIDLTNNDILRGCDEATIKPLNGYRVTKILLNLVPDLKVLRISLKFIKEWAKWRGVNRNIFGYFGGINWAICIAYTCILYPKSCASQIITRFFYTNYNFPWPHPIYLCEIQENSLTLVVWNRWKHVYKLYMRDPRIKCMPIITPAYPSMNSAVYVNKATREILLEEFSKAKKIVEETLSTNLTKPTKWYKILDPYIFFKSFKHFIVLEISSNNKKKFKILNGLIRSKIRNLVAEIYLHAKVRLWPIGFQLRSDEYFKINYYLGIRRNKSNKTDKKIYIRSSHR